MLGFYKYLKHLFFIYWPFAADENKLEAWMNYATDSDRQKIINLFGKKSITEVHPTAFRNMIYRLPILTLGELSTINDNETEVSEGSVHHGVSSGRIYDHSERRTYTNEELNELLRKGAGSERLDNIPGDDVPRPAELSSGDSEEQTLETVNNLAEGFRTTRIHEPDHTVVEQTGPFEDGLALLMAKDCDGINQLRSQVSVTKEFFYQLTNGSFGRQLTKGGVVVNRRNKRTKIITSGHDTILYEPRRNLGLFKVVNCGFNQGMDKLIFSIEVLDEKRFNEIHSLRLVPRLNCVGDIITFDYLED